MNIHSKITSNKTRTHVALVLLVFTLFSCASINPEAPLNSEIELSIPPQSVSSIKIPIKVNLRPYFLETDKSIPYRFEGSDQACEGVSYSYKFFRGPINFKGVNDQITFDIKGKYSLNLNYCPQCTSLFDNNGHCIIPRIYSSCGLDEPLRKIEVGYATKIGLTNDYKLDSKTNLRKIKTTSPCIVSVFEFDATTTLKKEITVALQDLESEIDSVISTVDLKPELAETWNYFTQPIDLEGYGFLQMNPSSVSMSPIKYKGDTAYFNAIIVAKPNVLTTPSERKVSPLPNLSDYNNKEGFDITMDIFSTYDSLSSILTKNIQGQEIVLKKNKIKFQNIEIHGASDRMLHLKVGFTGDKKGTLYLTGTPTFDSIHQKIKFDDLIFDVKTKSALLKSAKWMFDKKITSAIREASQVDLSPYLDSLKQEINKSINSEVSDGVFMNGKIESILISLIHPMENQLFLRVRSVGDLKLRM